MIVFLLILPLLVLISALLMYQHNGKRQFLRFDLIQFIYAFVLAPALFIWLKSFSFFLLRTELDLRLSVTELFILDSIFTILFLYIYAFIVIHSLTKSFKISKLHDPLYDIFHHSEYFHLWLTHLIMFGGGLGIVTLFSLTNSVVPLALTMSKVQFYSIVMSGLVAGIVAFVGVWISNPLQGGFMRIMKLLFGASFLCHLVAYFILDPRFRPEYVIYWMAFFMSAALVFCSLFFHRSGRAVRWVDRLKDYKWGLNIDVLKR